MILYYQKRPEIERAFLPDVGQPTSGNGVFGEEYGDKVKVYLIGGGNIEDGELKELLRIK